MSNLWKEKITIEAIPGAILEHAVMDAAIMALERRSSVVLTHNDVEYPIYPERIVDSIIDPITPQDKTP